MQNYGQQPPPGYHRPGSTNSFANAPAPPPPQYGAPPSQNQWAAPAQSQSQNQGQQWGQAQQTGGYNPNVYGAMPGSYPQAQVTPAHNAPAYPSQQDMPPPPPPKPAVFAAAVAQQPSSQNYGQQPVYGAPTPQQHTGYTQGTAVHTPQGGYQVQAQAPPQQSYNNAVPPAPSQTPGGSYFHQSQAPPVPVRPGSVYGVGQVGTSSTPVSAVSQPPQVPPYTQANTSPAPGAYAPPFSDVPAWQQTQQPPLQGSGAHGYTRPGAESNAYSQGHQSNMPTEQGQYGQTAQNQYPPQTPIQQQGQYGQQGNNQYPPTQHLQHSQNFQPEHNQTMQSPAQFPQQAPNPSNQYPPQNQTPQQSNQQPSQWASPPIGQIYGQQPLQQPLQQSLQQSVQQPIQQQGWQQGPQPQDSSSSQQQYHHGQNTGIQAPKPVSGTTPPGFVNETSPQTQPVSPLAHRQTMNFGSIQNQTGLSRTDSISSIALGSIHAQHGTNKTESPKPALVNAPPPRDDPARFSALGSGGPSDWEHFGAEGDVDDEEELVGAKKKEEAPGTVELPAQVPESSIPSDYPSPPDQPLPLNTQRRDDFQPTPELSERVTPSQTPHQPPAVQQSFVMDHGGWSAPMAQQQPSQPNTSTAPHQPPIAHQSFVMDNGSWPASSAPQQQPSQPNISTMPLGSYAAPSVNQGPPTHGYDMQMQKANQELQQNNQELKEAIKTKSDAYDALVKEMEKQKTDSRQELNELNVVLETVRKHTETERNSLDEHIETLKATIEQSKRESAALLKEKDATIERWQEDAEGKDNNVKEKESVIVELNKQLKEKNRIMEELKKELEAERLKEPPKPTAADLVPDLDPWYAGSLERYIFMLREEASAALVEDKIKTFTAFMKAESGIRGLEYYNTPPPAPAAQEPSQYTAEQQPSPALKHGKQDLNVQVPQQPQSPEDDIQYSPGGRPMIRRQTTIQFSEHASTQYSATEPFNQSGTILTPTSSQDGDFNKNPVAMQPVPEPQPQPQYKAYVPLVVNQGDSAKSLKKQATHLTNVAPVAPVMIAGPAKGDEIFFGGPASQTSSRPPSRPKTGTPSEVPLPSPLSTPRPASISTPAPIEKDNPLIELKSLIPTKIIPLNPSSQLEKVRKKMSNISSDTTFVTNLTTSWEQSADAIRKRNADARRKREEESEASTDQLFNDNEISYAEIAAIEDEFKEKERQLKAQEDRAEYESYEQSVFSKVYSTLHEQIKALSDIYIDAESLLQTSVSGVKTLEGGGTPTAEQSLKLLREVHEQLETRHDNVVLAVSERDKRYKKTEIQPLYAAGNIPKMKTIERHFENAEKQGAARAKSEKAQRLRDFNTVVQEIVVQAIAVEQREIGAIVDCLHTLSSSPSSSISEDEEQEIVARATETIAALKASTKSLLAHLNALDLDLNACESDAAVAQAKASNATADQIAGLERDKETRDKEIRDEFERKIRVVEQDDGVDIGVVRKRRGKTAVGVGCGAGVGAGAAQIALGNEDEGAERLSEEEEKKRRLQRALEEAKRRNGDL